MATSVGVLHLELMIGDATNLKAKRRVLKSFRDRLAARHNVSVAEVDHQNHPQRARLAVAMVGSDGRYVQAALQKLTNAAAEHRGMYVVASDIEMW